MMKTGTKEKISFVQFGQAGFYLIKDYLHMQSKACQQGKVYQVFIKSICGYSICLTQKIAGLN